MAELTIEALKEQFDVAIRSKTALNSITQDDVADQFDAVAEEIKNRGFVTVANTAALATQSGLNSDTVMVLGVGIFKFKTTGTANGTSIFSAADSGVWEMEISKLSSAYSESEDY